MSWREVSKDVFERPIAENETFIKLIGDSGAEAGHEMWAISSQVDFVPNGSLHGASERLEACLRSGWQQLRFSLPNMAAHIVEDSKLRYEVPDTTALKSWTAETFIVESSNTTPADVITTRKPTSLAKIHYFPYTSQLVLTTSHWRTDGIGIFLILDRYLDLVCQCAASAIDTPGWGEEVSRLCPSIEEVAQLSHEKTPEIMKKAEEAAGTFGLIPHAVGVEFKGNATTTPGGTLIRSIKLEPSETSAIVAACEDRGVSVTAAVHASIAAANYAFTDRSNTSKHYTSTIRFGIRAYMPQPSPLYAHAAGLFTSGYMFKVPAANSWSENATTYHHEYRKGYSDLLPAHRQYTRLLCDAIKNMPVPSPDDIPPSELDISSVGVVDKFIRSEYMSGDAKIEVKHVTVGTEMLTRQMVCFVWTFRDRLNLQIVFNEAFYDSKRIEEMLHYIKETTMMELDIER